MTEFFKKKPRELLEIKRGLNDLVEDLKHPINNNRHPYHQDSIRAFKYLMAYANSTTQNWASD